MPAAEPLLPGFRQSPFFNEQIREEWHDGNVRVLINAPKHTDGKKPARLIVYATPNGNTIEQTLGCAKAEGLDWHFDIQHVAAQVRRYREVMNEENVFVAVVEAGGLSWPGYRAKFKDNPERIRKLIDGIVTQLPAKDVRITLTGHSGGGSFKTGFINASDAIPANIDRIAYLDSNYSYNDDDRHGDKLLKWLGCDKNRRLVVIAYDDREITLNGKKVVGPTGGTWRASQRMLERFRKDVSFIEKTDGDFETHSALDGRILFHLHRNPQNKILHTALVGEMNGLLEALLTGTGKDWGRFGGHQAFTSGIQPAPGIPKRSRDSLAGSKLIPILQGLPKADREKRIASELLAGNCPEFERSFVKVSVKVGDSTGRTHEITFEVMPDYLALGDDADFVRMPMTPQTATLIGEAWGCVLPTKKMVDVIHKAAAVKLEPKPLGEPRESVLQFANHNRIIEEQRSGLKLGELVSGIKKDIVMSNRIFEKPKRLAIYGWHKADGSPIQPLTIVHHDGYIDYSHGVRFVKRTVMLDGKPRDIRDVLRDASLWRLLSDEGVLTHPGYE